MSLRDQIFEAASALPFEDLKFPAGSGITVRICGLSSRERDLFEDETGLGTSEYTADNIRARLLARTTIDPKTGDKVFSEEGDVETLGAMPATDTQEAFNVAMRLSAFTAQDVEELAKNSESTPTPD